MELLSRFINALFWRVNKGGNLTPPRMTNQTVYNMLEKRGAEVGIRDFSLTT
jgi:hypothetical protein